MKRGRFWLIICAALMFPVLWPWVSTEADFAYIPRSRDWIPLAPPQSFSGDFQYNPEGFPIGGGAYCSEKPCDYSFRIDFPAGQPGLWRLVLIPQNDEASYYWWWGPIENGEPYLGEIFYEFGRSYRCGQQLDVGDMAFPGTGEYGLIVYADFSSCGARERTASSSFTLEWVLLQSPATATPTPTPEPTVTPEPTPTPEPLAEATESLRQLLSASATPMADWLRSVLKPKPETVVTYDERGVPDKEVELSEVLNDLKVGEQCKLSMKGEKGRSQIVHVVRVGPGEKDLLIKGLNGRWYEWKDRRRALSRAYSNRISDGYKNGRDAVLSAGFGVDRVLYGQIQDHYVRQKAHDDASRRWLARAFWWVVDKTVGVASTVGRVGLNVIGLGSREKQIETCYKQYEAYMKEVGGDHEAAMQKLEAHVWARGRPYSYAVEQTDYDGDKQPDELGQILRRTFFIKNAKPVP